MQPHAIRERISYLHRSRKYLLLSLLAVNTLFILIISVSVVYFFNFGYHRQSVPIEGPIKQGWVRGEWVDQVVGTVVEKNGTIFTIEREGERIDLEIVGKVFHRNYEEKDEMGGELFVPQELIDASQISVGQFLSATKLDGSDDLNSIFESGIIVRVWD